MTLLQTNSFLHTITHVHIAVHYWPILQTITHILANIALLLMTILQAITHVLIADYFFLHTLTHVLITEHYYCQFADYYSYTCIIIYIAYHYSCQFADYYSCPYQYLQTTTHIILVVILQTVTHILINITDYCSWSFSRLLLMTRVKTSNFGRTCKIGHFSTSPDISSYSRLSINC